MPDLKAPDGHMIPPLLQKFADWFEEQEHNSLGACEIEIGVPYWNDESANRLKRDGFSFLLTGDGSNLVLLNTGKKTPPAVCLLGSEGATGTIANSLEEFLQLLATGETGVMDLDDPDASGRKKLKSWLSRNKVEVPPSDEFDFDAYLDGGSGMVVKAEPLKPTKTQPIPEAIAKLPSPIREVALIIGRRVDDPEVVKFITGTLGKKLPTSTTGAGNKFVVDKKHGLDFSINHEIINEKYPLIPKTKNSYTPYVSLAWLNKNLGDILPFGLKFGMTEKDLTSVLGAPSGERGFGEPSPYWERVLDPVREIVMDIMGEHYTIKIAENHEIRPYLHDTELRVVTGALVAWAVLRGLMNERKFAEHLELIEAIQERQKQGSALVDVALPRGLWDIHIKDAPGLRTFMYEWVHNQGDKFIGTDLMKALGSPIVDDDWKTMAKIIPVFDKRFAKWVKQ